MKLAIRIALSATAVSGLVLSFAAIHADASPGPSTVAPPTTGSSVAGRSVSNGVPMTAKTRHWTAEEKAAAKPMPIPVVTTDSSASAAITKPTGPPGVIAGALPDGVSASSGGAIPFAAAETTSGVSPTAFSYPTPFDRYREPSTGTFPNSTVGKVFFVQDGQNFVCSAAVIAEHAIWLAGHCVSDGNGHYSTNLIFEPQYNSGGTPKGTFACPSLTTLVAWHTTANRRYDEGIAVCNNNAAGQTPRAAVGRLGFTWNVTEPRHYNSLGYPQAAPFNGATMQHCQSSFGHFDTLIGGTGPTPFAIGCDMTGGASGGPWILNYVPGQSGATINLLNGHNDYKRTTPSQPLEMNSPYFDDSARTLLCNATEIC
jgi:V8-like Glu-specific endopeptidase